MMVKAALIIFFIVHQVLAFYHEDVHDMERAAREAELQPSNFDELMANNEAFRNLTEIGVPQKRVVAIISAVTAGFSLLKGIADQIDVGRVCVIGLSNNGNRKLIEPTWYLESGIIKNPLPREIAPGDAGVFTFEKTQYATYGTAGVLTYTIEGTNTQIEVLWSVPFNLIGYSNRFNIEMEENQSASSKIYDNLYDNEFQEVSNGGHWMHRSHNNVKVHAAMTNNAKASLLVEVYYNMTTSATDIFGK